MWNPFELSAAPLSAYTPGQGDTSMEGGFETATGRPMITLEMHLADPVKYPYVTGATNQKNPSGQVVYRTVGDNIVPVKIDDYGPGVKGIDIATANKKWATNFPYQGAKDTTILAGPDIKSTVPSPTSGGAYAFGTGSNPGAMGTIADYANAQQRGSQIASVGSSIGNALSQIGQQQARQGQVGMSQAMAMLQQRRSNPSAYAPLPFPNIYG